MAQHRTKIILAAGGLALALTASVSSDARAFTETPVPQAQPQTTQPAPQLQIQKPEAGDGPVCQGNEPLAPLAVLTASVKPAQPGLRARAMHKAKVARQVKSARRSARKGKRAKMKRLTTAGRSRKIAI